MKTVKGETGKEKPVTREAGNVKGKGKPKSKT